MVAAIKVTARPTFKDLAGQWEKLTAESVAEKRAMMRGLGRRYVVIAKDEAPKKTGGFARGIRFRSFSTGSGVAGGGVSVGFTVSTPQPLGKWIIEGTKPHEITPKRPGYPLRFFWEKVGKVVYTYRVSHPGTKPNPFIERAKDRWLPESRRALGRFAHNIAVEFGSRS
jgi:hypothetical protein